METFFSRRKIENKPHHVDMAVEWDQQCIHITISHYRNERWTTKQRVGWQMRDVKSRGLNL